MMPKCCKCQYKQSRLNAGRLCKKCYEQKQSLVHKSNHMAEALIDANVSTYSNKANDNIEESSDREFMEVIKEFMLEDKIKQVEFIDSLKEQIVSLKEELKEKNKHINNLILRIPIAINVQNNYPDDSELLSSTTVSHTSHGSHSKYDNNSHNDNTQTSERPLISEYSKWHLVDDNKKKKRSKSPEMVANCDNAKYNTDITTTNRYQVLDEYSDFENEYSSQNVHVNKSSINPKVEKSTVRYE